ncbi:BON domain-containing protein [Janthinobacterium sp.]|uniref:BON domain-containing protein n=1 Tax=Janthinobacterium sp. TaxID=1871054 RepID=UPI00293D9F6A|nr:BON domain-containing protein [Janthinobacterium sp.]
MNRMTLLALSGAAGIMFSAGTAMAQSDSGQSYESLVAQASSDYRSAIEKCDGERGQAKKVCVQEAKVARARADADAVAQFQNTPSKLGKARTALADAEYDLAKAKCADRYGSATRGTCLREAKTAQRMAVADAKTGAPAGSTAMTGVENCAQMSGVDKAGCMTRHAADSAGHAITDTVITSKIKADLVKDPDLKAMDVHVETVNGVVTLSGFVPSEMEANKARELARGVSGVSEVKSDLKVKMDGAGY